MLPGAERGPRVTSPQPQDARTGRSPRRQEVTERIKQYILTHALRPGDALPTEGELCTALEASRSSVREAIKTLDALDIVEVRHGHGTYVGPLSLAALVEGLTFRGMLSPSGDARILSDLVDVRELIERGMAGAIIAALDPTQLDILDRLVSTMEQRAHASASFVDADREFHALLVEPLGNELISQLSSAFWDVYARVAPHLNVVTSEDEQATIAAHRQMVAAARVGDINAFTLAVGEHYAPVRRRLALNQDDD